MASLDLPFGQQPLDISGEREQANGVGDVRSRVAEPFGHGLLRHAEILEQFLERPGQLERSQILAMDVLDQRFTERLGVVAMTDDRRDRGQPRQPGRSNPPLPGHQLVAPVPGPNDHRLEHADLTDGASQRSQRFLGEIPARLSRVRGDGTHGDLEQPAVVGRPRYER